MTEQLPTAELRAWVKQTRELAERLPLVAAAAEVADALHTGADRIEALLDAQPPEKTLQGGPSTGPRR